MRPSSINFADPRILRVQPFRSWSMLLVAAGVVLISYAGIQLESTQRAKSAANEALDATGANAIRRRDSAPTEDGAIPASKVIAANAAIQRMNVPWRDLMDALEQATPPEVAIVELNPDPSQGELAGEAEAKNLEGMTSYISRLQTSPLFNRVVLVRHEINVQDVNHPVRFKFQAFWTTAKRGSK